MLCSCATDETGSLEPELVCEHDQMHLIIKKNLLEKQGLNATSGHLNEPRCNQRADHQEAMWYTVQRSGSTCGNTVEVRPVTFPRMFHVSKAVVF